MPSQLEITTAVIQKIAKKAGFALPLKPDMGLTESPLSLSDSKVRRLVNNLRNLVKKNRPDVALKKAEVADAKTVRGVVQLIIKKIRDETVGNKEADDLITAAQS